MDERKFRILRAIIDDYILTGVPVGSRTISKKEGMQLSSATIRNEMSDLEDEGYLEQPHVSAGRIPSAKAYRLYVDHLMETGSISSDRMENVMAHFSDRARHMDEAIDHAAQILSDLTHYTAIAIGPSGKEPVIRHIQLVPVSETAALVVIVTDVGIVQDNLIPVSSDLDPDALYAISRDLSEKLGGHSLSEANELLPRMEADRRSAWQESGLMVTALEDTMRKAAESPNAHIAVGGTSNLLAFPEYNDMDKVRNFLSLLETRDKLAAIINNHGEMSLTVRIGPENGIPDLDDCSIVTATYSTRSGRQGTIGVIGPTRMQYSRVMNALSGMGSELSKLFSRELPAEGETPGRK